MIKQIYTIDGRELAELTRKLTASLDRGCNTVPLTLQPDLRLESVLRTEMPPLLPFGLLLPGHASQIRNELEWGYGRWFNPYMKGHDPIVHFSIGKEARDCMAATPFAGSNIFPTLVKNIDDAHYMYPDILRGWNAGAGTIGGPPRIDARCVPAQGSPTPNDDPRHLDEINPDMDAWTNHHLEVVRSVGANWPPMPGVHEELYGFRQLSSIAAINHTRLFDLASRRAAVVAAPAVSGASTGMSMSLRGRQRRFVHASVTEGVPARLQLVIEYAAPTHDPSPSRGAASERMRQLPSQLGRLLGEVLQQGVRADPDPRPAPAPAGRVQPAQVGRARPALPGAGEPRPPGLSSGAKLGMSFQ